MSDEQSIHQLNMTFSEGAAGRALARRDEAFFAAQRRRPVELAWNVIVSLGGLYVFKWSPSSIWAFLLIAQWSAILRNALKLILAGPAVRAYYEGVAEDAEVWQWVHAARNGRDLDTLKPPPEKNWSVGGLLALDLMMLGIATAVILTVAAQRDITLLAGLFAEQAMLWVTGFTVLCQVALPLFWDSSPATAVAPATMTYDAGGATLVSWVLMFVFIGVADTGDGLVFSILILNGFVILGVPLSILAIKAYRESTRWLRNTLTSVTPNRGE